MSSTVALIEVSTWHRGFLAAIHDHYTESRGAPPGKKLAWRIMADGRHIGWIGIGEPAYKLAPRRRLGLEDARPLPGTACCFIYRREVGHGPRGSDILDAYHEVAARDWARKWDETIVHWETLVLPSAVDSKVPGACFRSAGYRPLGYTTGASARRPAGHTRGPRIWTHGNEPKLVLYRGPLARVCILEP